MSNAKNYRSKLQSAASEGRSDAVEKLLNDGADINEQDESDGSTPLILASERGHVTVVRLLLDRGASLTICKTDRWRPLHIAAYNGHGQVVQLLIGAGSELDWPDCQNSTPLHVATLYGYLDVVRRLLVSGADSGKRDYCGRLPLHLACQYGHMDTVILLLQDAPKLVESPDATKSTPLHTAAKMGRAAIAKLLLDNGANADALDAAGKTPIELATQAGHIKTLKCMLPWMDTSMEVTSSAVLRLAAAFGQVECFVAILRHCNSSVEAARSALHGLPQTESVRRLTMHLESARFLAPDTSTAEVRNTFCMPTLIEALELAGFNLQRMKYLHNRAMVQQGIIRCQIADSIDWSGCEAHLVGSYRDGCGNSFVCADGSTDLSSDIDVLLVDKSLKTLHIEPFCQCPAVLYSDKVSYEDGHVMVSGFSSNPTKYYGPSRLKPAMDMVPAQWCCCYPTIALFENARHFPKHVLDKLKVEVARPQSCHVVSASAPDKRGKQKRIGTTFLERIVMENLTSEQCKFFVTLKYLVKCVISNQAPGLKTYHVKTLLFEALDATPPEQWQHETLRLMLLMALETMESKLRAMQSGDLKFLQHFFLPHAVIYLKDSSNPAAIADSLRNVIDSIDERLSEFAATLRRADNCIVFNPFLNLALVQCKLQYSDNCPSQDDLKDLPSNLYTAMAAVNKCMNMLDQHKPETMADFSEAVAALALTEHIGPFAISAKVSIRVLILMKLGRQDQARDELVQLINSSHSSSEWFASGAVSLKHCESVQALSKQLQQRNCIAKFCCRLGDDDDDEFKLEAAGIQHFQYDLFPIVLSNHISAYYMNFNALAIYLAFLLVPAECRDRCDEMVMRLAEDTRADLQEVFLALKFVQDTCRLVGIVLKHRRTIGEEPVLQQALQHRICSDKKFEESIIDWTCGQILGDPGSLCTHGTSCGTG